MSSEAQFRITYCGPGLDTNEMDVRQLAPALHAVGDLLEHANRVLNGGKTRVSVLVKGSFKAGSFEIDLKTVMGFWDSLGTVFASQDYKTANELLKLLGFSTPTVYVTGKSLLSLLRWLKNRDISRVEYVEDGGVVVHAGDEHIEAEQQAIRLLQDYEVRKSLHGVVVEPLEKPGIERFSTASGGGEPFVVERAEAAHYATPPAPDEELADQVSPTNLQLVSPSFAEDNKWRFTDGSASFHATIADQDFLQRVQNSEIYFAKGDVLRVQLRTRQWLAADGKMKAEYTVQEVLNHRSAAVQIPLPFERKKH